MVFDIPDEQLEKVRTFHPKCKRNSKPGLGSYVITPTGIGLIIKYVCKCGKVLDLTEVEKW